MFISKRRLEKLESMVIHAERRADAAHSRIEGLQQLNTTRTREISKLQDKIIAILGYQVCFRESTASEIILEKIPKKGKK